MNEELINALKAARLHIQGEALPTKAQALDIIKHALEAAAGAPDLRNARTDLSKKLRHIAKMAAVDILHAQKDVMIKAAEEIERLASAAPVEALTPEAIDEVWESMPGSFLVNFGYDQFARAIEARIMGGVK